VTSRSGLSRRSLFKAAVAAVVAAAGAGYRHAPTQESILAARLRALVPHAAAAAVLGAAYLERVPSEASTDTLVAAILPDRSADRARTLGDGLRDTVGQRVRDDFATGRTLVLRGWVVSVTEGRLAALVLTG
jgi:hypothetical protein